MQSRTKRHQSQVKQEVLLQQLQTGLPFLLSLSHLLNQSRQSLQLNQLHQLHLLNQSLQYFLLLQLLLLKQVIPSVLKILERVMRYHLT
jgi:hypothetical protein